MDYRIPNLYRSPLIYEAEIKYDADVGYIHYKGNYSYIPRNHYAETNIKFGSVNDLIKFFNQIEEYEDEKLSKLAIAKIHEKYPTVKEAFEQYQLLLKLCQK